MASQQAGIALGPFQLSWPLAVGGMGEVWRAMHVAQEVPVAVKVLTNESARELAFVSAFRHEVRAVAGLDHPGIVTVYDHGEVPGEAATLSEGRLSAGSPYLVMELVDGAGLGASLARLPWEDTRRVLLSILDALAHAHARGVVHRDLKPGNVLRRAVDGAIKLTDFGIAHAVERDRALRLDELPTGTPPYMAPEQITASWRDYGPWTDLYSLGCLAWALASGAPPFGGGDRGAEALTWSHLRHDPPPLVPRIAVPAGFEPWLRRLLEKEPTRRFTRAADAAWALFRLGDATLAPGADALPPDVPNAQAVTDATELDSGCVALTFVGSGDATRTRTLGPSISIRPQPLTSSGSVALGDEHKPPTLPPLPISWRRPTARAETARLVGVGLGLYGLRPVPLVGRTEERTELWSLLRQVREEGTARFVLLRGPAGCGKSRVAEWLAERAHELGAATPLRALHGPVPGPALGLAPMIARHFRCLRMSHADALDRVSQLLRARGVDDPDEWLALAEMVAPSEGERMRTSADPRQSSARRIRFQSDAERYALLRRTITRIATERPVVVWLDDVQWGLDALAFAAHLIEANREQSLPVLIVATARDESLAERAEEVRLLTRLLARPETHALEIGPLPAEHRAALVRELLGLDDELAARVEERTAGNPLFAVQLVGDWVQRGVLAPGPRGFLLAPGAHEELPADLHAIWIARTDRVLQSRPPADRIALELAAVLGQDVDLTEWREVCVAAGAIAGAGLVDALVMQRLARVHDQGGAFAFVHGMLRESLERGAREDGRSEAHHRVCARVLDARGGRGVAERVGMHLLAAGDLEAALGPLLSGAADRLVAGDYRTARVLLREREGALDQLGHPGDSRVWGEGWVLLAQVAREQGDLDEADQWAARAIERADAYDWGHIAAQARVESALTARSRGQLWTATIEAHEAERLAEQGGDRRTLAAACRAMGDALRSQGALVPASECYERAAATYRDLRDDDGWAWSQVGLSMVARLAARHEETHMRASMAREAFEAVGSRRGLASCCNVLGEPARWDGRLEDAERLYTESRDHFRAIGAFEAVLPEANIGVLRIIQGRYPEARRLLENAARTCEARGARLPLGAISLFLLPCAAHGGDFAEWDRLMGRAQELLAESGMTDPDLPIAARIAGDIAASSGEPERAREAYAMAAAQLGALGRTLEASELQRLATPAR